MQTSRKKRGFSLAETLIVIAIVVILAALAFAYFNPRSMTKRQYDDYAKEIFIAAQNHLTLASTLNYLGRTVYGTAEMAQPVNTSDGISLAAGNESGVYYYVVDAVDSLSNNASLLNLMLPFGSIDETLRGGGKYIIRYQPVSGLVLDVFYWETSGRYPHTYSGDDYSDFLSKRENKAALRNYESDKSVIGYYGGVKAADAAAIELIRPQLWVENGDTLTVHITDSNTVAHKLELIIDGANSGSPTAFGTSALTEDNANSIPNKLAAYTLTLDDITSQDDKFAVVLNGSGIKPGDDLILRAVVSDPKVATNIASSDEVGCNSLFADSTSYSEHRADIANIRHLENLDPNISGLQVSYTSALQLVNLDRKSFMDGGGQILVGNLTYDYAPVNPAAALNYDGGSHTVANLKSELTGEDAGMFGQLKDGSKVKDLRITDFSFSGTNAGALAGQASGTEVTNVLACLDLSPTAHVSGVSNAGGLIGKASGSGANPCTISYCAAAATVDGSGATGGLIGLSESVTVSGCAAGGRTTNGKYSATDYNVNGGSSAGGLIGTLSGGSVTGSYSTCSVTGTIAGGLIGSVTGTPTVSKCYATGLVSGSSPDKQGAFGGTSFTATDCYYYEIVNEQASSVSASGAEFPVFTYMTAFPGGDNGVGKLDADVAEYNTQFKYGGSAIPYDTVLLLYFAGNYPLPTVFDLLGTTPGGTSYYVTIHHGDWPAPEILIISRS